MLTEACFSFLLGQGLGRPLAISEKAVPCTGEGDHDMKTAGELILYHGPDGATRVEARLAGDTFWPSQRQVADLFGVDIRTIV